MFPLYFMIFFFIRTDGTFGSQTFVNSEYVAPGLCEMYIEDTKETLIQHDSSISKITGWCEKRDWPFESDAQPKGST